jgi:hypothetical protein
MTTHTPTQEGAMLVAAERIEEFNPDQFDIRWNADYTLAEVTPLAWWDDASYLAYQGDPVEAR